VRKWGEEGQVKKMAEMKARGGTASHTRPGLLKEAHKVYLAPPFPFVVSAPVQPTPTPPPRPTVLNIPAFGEVRPGLLAPSALLAEPAFRSKADKAFVHGFSTQTAVSRATRTWIQNLPELGCAADHIAGLMPARLQRHLAKTRVEAKGKSSHWCWSFATDNFNTVVALMALAGHLEEDYKPLKWDSAFLANDLQRFKNIASDRQNNELRQNTELRGAYLFYDANKSNSFVRSGKASITIWQRVLKHSTGAELKDIKSFTKFYTSYPTRAGAARNPQIEQGLRVGYFEHLKALVALGYKTADGEDVIKTFIWSAPTMTALSACKSFDNGNVVCSLTEKQLKLVDYVIELVYELALAPELDVSENPGFESVLGIFGSNDSN
jgi:hypothetical protein